MYHPNIVYKKRQCTEAVPIYYGEHSRRAESDASEFWLADDLNWQGCWTLIGWQRMKCAKNSKEVDNEFQEDKGAYYEVVGRN